MKEFESSSSATLCTDPRLHSRTRILQDSSPTKGGGVVVTHVPPREPVTGARASVESILVQAKQVSAAQISEHFKTSVASGQYVLEGIAMLGGEQGA
jgi:hypothetical protein